MKKVTVLLALMLLASFTWLQAQTRQITGTVTTSEDGSALPGVSVAVVGTTIGVITNVDGMYSIPNVPADAQFIEVRFVGYETQRIEIGGKSVVDVVLNPASIALDEVVVTAIGIKRESKALGYAVQTVDTEELTKANNADVINSLAAKTAGVQINSSGGTAGASAYITIRGAASITRDNQPLFVVDGVPIISGGGGGGVGGVATSGRTIELNPEEIESMTVLKGGAATALYGVQAANGAIIITTKRGGDDNRVSVDISSAYTVEMMSQVPGRQDTYAQGYGGNWISGYSMSWGPKMSASSYSKDPSVWGYPLFDVYGAIVPTLLADGTANPLATDGPVTPFDAYQFFQQGYTLNNNVSIRSGNEKNSYFFSVGDYEQEGIVPNNTFGKTNIRLNASSKVHEKVEVGTNLSYINSRGNFIQQGSNVSGVMLGLLRTPPSFDNAAGYIFADNGQRTYRHTAGGAATGYDNPYWVANEISYLQNINRIMGSTFLAWDVTDWLDIRYNLGMDAYTSDNRDWFPIGSRALTTGGLAKNYSFRQSLNSDLLFNFKYDVSEDLKLRLTVGQNAYQYKGSGIGGSVNGMEFWGFDHFNNSPNQFVSEWTSMYRTAAVFGDLQVDFKNMLYLGMTLRNEWSTTMPEDNLSAMFPSVNLGFVFTELEPLKDNSFLSFGKIRGSYAITANIAPAYATSTSFFSAGAGDGWTTGLAFPLMGYTGYTWGSTVGNTNLKHESMKTIEVGTDLKFFNNRVGLDLAYFMNINEDLLLSVPIAASTGYASSYMNAATMESKGIEVTVYATPVKTSSFSWDIMANFTKMTNTVTALAPGVDDVFLGGFTDPQVRAVAGQEYRSIYGYDYYRYDANGDGEITLDEPYVINDNPNDGYPDGKPMTDESKMVPLGSVNPDWIANISNNISFKGLSLSFLIDIKKGGLMYNGTRFAMNYFGTSIGTANREVYYNPDGSINFELTPAENLVVYEGVLGHLDGDNNVVTTGETANMPTVNDQTWFTGQGSNFGGGATAGAVENAGWVRLREITLSYNLGNELLNKLPFRSASVYVTGKNLWLSTPYTGVDPETSLLGASNAQGFDYFNMPGSKSVTFGLRLGF
jgi:TonB-linked SusC/RagA family outer membrane protein